jgi:uncharacterized iron-regulated membrane protein
MRNVLWFRRGLPGKARDFNWHNVIGFWSSTGEIVKWEPYASQSLGRRLRTWSRWIHTGEAGGVIGQTVAGLVSTGAVVLVWTGIALACRRLIPAGLRKQTISRPAGPAVSIQGASQEELS